MQGLAAMAPRRFGLPESPTSPVGPALAHRVSSVSTAGYLCTSLICIN